MRTGKLLWTFHTVPQAGELGVETWGKDPQTGQDSWKFTGNTGAWGPLTGDEELGYVYIPVEAPSGDTYGGQRPGANLFSDSVVCLDAKTGKRDLALPADPPRNVGLRYSRRAHPARHHGERQEDQGAGAGEQVGVHVRVRPHQRHSRCGRSKSGRRRKGNAPGEWYSPTQPFPTKPAAFDRQGVTEADLADYTPEIKAEALKVASQYVLGPIYTPPIVKDTGGKAGDDCNCRARAAAPTGWARRSIPRPACSTFRRPPARTFRSLSRAATRSEMPYIAAGGLGGTNVMGLPLIKGPYGRITAINLNTGDHAWMIPNGKPADNLVNNPALKAAEHRRQQLGRRPAFADSDHQDAAVRRQRQPARHTA